MATHFFLPKPVLRDPVVTSSESMLRFEGFSGCCGVYVPVDLPPELFEREFQGRFDEPKDRGIPVCSKAFSKTQGQVEPEQWAFLCPRRDFDILGPV